MPINTDQFFLIYPKYGSIDIVQHIWSVLIGIDRHWWTLGIDPGSSDFNQYCLLSMLINTDQFFFNLSKIWINWYCPTHLIGIDRHWWTLGIDPGSPYFNQYCLLLFFSFFLFFPFLFVLFLRLFSFTQHSSKLWVVKSLNNILNSF